MILLDKFCKYKTEIKNIYPIYLLENILVSI